MVRVCGFCDGESVNYDSAKLKRCAGCQKVYYCSTDCQKRHWVFHIFECNPLQPINTAYYLARAVYKDEIPVHPQTLDDYGFNRAVTAEEGTMLFGLYIGLIKIRHIPPKTIHNWRIRGVLVEEIKATFLKLPEQSRGVYFRWFLDHQDIVALAGQPLSEQSVQACGDAIMVRAWRFAGGSEKDSVEEIRDAIAGKSAEEQQCYTLYSLLLSMWRPSPDIDLWICFGFASCASERGEAGLCSAYQHLIKLCTFKEFCDAYRGRRLLDLFQSKGVRVQDPRGHLRDLLHGPSGVTKSVWHLKQSVVREDCTTKFKAAPSVMVDYCFMNCKSDSEAQKLRRVYKAFFDSPSGDPLALHEAATKGNIHGYLSMVVNLKELRDLKLKRLMKNPYPLPGL